MGRIELPEDVLSWFRDVFAACNKRVTRKVSLVPNAPEPSLDMTFVEHFTQYGMPRVFGSGFTVRVDTHFLGGLRHFYGRWEIADIGLLVHFRRGGKLLRSKAAVLQSKRLYPEGISVKEDVREDYEIGFARLADPEDVRVPLSLETRFNFDFGCRYAELRTNDEQYKKLKAYVSQSKIPVCYQLYNPATLPFTRVVPLPSTDGEVKEIPFGVRVLPVADVFAVLDKKPKHYAPTVAELAGKPKSFDFGWRLEYFVADLLLKCKLGYAYKDIRDEQVYNLFNRRSGAISAAVAFSIEYPE
jgi:hypothetical protein